MNGLLILCLLLGIAARRFFSPPDQLVPAINWWLISIALPCVIVTLIPHTVLNKNSLFPIAAMWLVFAGALLVAVVLGRMLGWSRATIGVVALVAGIGNTSFMGFPIISGYYGTEGLKIAVIADQPGSFLILSTVGVLVMAFFSGNTPTLRMMLHKIVTFPPLIALVFSLLIRPLGGLPQGLEVLLSSIGQTMTPLALFTVGVQIKLRPPRFATLPLVVGVTWKLVLAPALVLLLAFFSPIDPLTKNVTVLQGGMAPMIAASIMAQRANLNPELSNAIQGYGILFSFASIVGWHLLL